MKVLQTNCNLHSLISCELFRLDFYSVLNTRGRSLSKQYLTQDSTSDVGSCDYCFRKKLPFRAKREMMDTNTSVRRI